MTISVEIHRLSIICLLMQVLCGCAAIRRLNPIESNTMEARRLTQQAQAAIHQSQWEEAETKLVKAIERCPEDTHARSVLADVLWQRGAERAAVEQKSRSVQLAGRRDAYELTELGQMELSIGNLEQALAHADEAIRQDDGHADAWTLRGFALRGLTRHEESLGAFFRSLSIRNDDPRTRLEIAKIYRETGQPRRGLAVLGAAPEDAVVACPHYPDVCYLRGLLLRDLERPADAVNSFASAHENGCVAPDLLLHLADSQLSAGEYLQARTTLKEAENAQNGDEIRVALNELQRRLEATNTGETAGPTDVTWQ